MASIRRRGDDRWDVRWRELKNGRLVQRTHTVRSAAGAELVKANVERDVSVHGEYLGFSRNRKPKTRGVGSVYFIEAAGRIKIGFAVNPTSRLADLQCGCPVPMRLLGTIDGRASLEGKWHRAFAADRLHGEWFTASTALLEGIAGQATLFVTRPELLALASA